MKKLFILFVISLVFSQSYIDVLILKNGDIIKGQIIENEINQYIKIKLYGGSILTYKYDSISRIEVEEVKTRTFGQKNNYSKEKETKIVNCFSDGYQSGKQIETQGAMWAGFGSGFLLGLIGMGISYSIVANNDYEPPKVETVDMESGCMNDYFQGYNESASKQKKSANLLGGTLGILTLLIIAADASTY